MDKDLADRFEKLNDQLQGANLEMSRVLHTIIQVKNDLREIMVQIDNIGVNNDFKNTNNM